MLLQNSKPAFVFFIAVTLSGLSLLSCSVPPSVTIDVSETSTEKSDDQRETISNVAKTTLSDLVDGNNAFAFNLYQAVRDGDSNLFFSPYSISIALAMTYAGARANTEKQMANVLHYTLPQDQLHPAFNYLEHNLTNLDTDVNNQGENFILRVANSIWEQYGYQVLPEYVDLISKNYGAGIRLVDFVDGGNREQARSEINDWVNEQTEGKIEDMIPEGILTELTRMVLANAIYFKVEWEDPFLNGTRDDEFHLLDGSSITVPMMSRREYANYVDGTGYQAIEIPYKGERFQMVILLPKERRFDEIESSMNNEFVNSILNGFKSEDLKLYLPKFEYEASLSLAKILAKMGMPDAFDKIQADFSGMVKIPPNLYITQIEHKAFVSVDEIGTEAAAATGVVAEIESEPVVVKINHPFIFLIRDNESGTIIFIGRVMNPVTK